MGNYEIDYEKPFVRLRVNGSEYEYLVSNEIFGEKALQATRLFAYAYDRGIGDLRRDLRGLLNT
jgi:hypothetical protein